MRNTPFRLITVFGAFIVLYAIIVGRLFYFQVVLSETFRDLGKYQSNEILELDSGRGDIISSDNSPIATNKVTYLLHANPKLIRDRAEYAERLASILELDEASISARLDRDLFWVKLKDGLSEATKEKIESLKLEGLGFQKESLRFYPEASMAAHLVGFVGKDDKGGAKGYFGLEGFYNQQLEGRPGRRYVVKDALGNPILCTNCKRSFKIRALFV